MSHASDQCIIDAEREIAEIMKRVREQTGQTVLGVITRTYGDDAIQIELLMQPKRPVLPNRPTFQRARKRQL